MPQYGSTKRKKVFRINLIISHLNLHLAARTDRLSTGLIHTISKPILNKCCKPTVNILCQLCEHHDIFSFKIFVLQALIWITEIKLKIHKLSWRLPGQEKKISLFWRPSFDQNTGILFWIGETNNSTRFHHYGYMIISTVDPMPKVSKISLESVELKHANVTPHVHSVSAFCTKNMSVFD